MKVLFITLALFAASNLSAVEVKFITALKSIKVPAESSKLELTNIGSPEQIEKCYLEYEPHGFDRYINPDDRFELQTDLKKGRRIEAYPTKSELLDLVSYNFGIDRDTLEIDADFLDFKETVKMLREKYSVEYTGGQRTLFSYEIIVTSLKTENPLQFSCYNDKKMNKNEFLKLIESSNLFKVASDM